MASANVVDICGANNVRYGSLNGGIRSLLLVVKQGEEVTLAHELDMWIVVCITSHV